MPWFCLPLAAAAGLLQAWSLAWPWQRFYAHGQPLWWLQVASLAVLAALLLNMQRVRHGVQAGWVFATVWLCATFWWLFISMHTYGGLAAPLAALAVFALAAFLALYYAAACALFVAWRGQGITRNTLLFAAAWLLAELARGQWWTGFPWGAGGYAHVDGPLARIAPWGGVYGIGAVAAALALLLADWGRSRRWRNWPTALALLLVPLPSPTAAPHAPVSVALLQGNISQGEKFQASSGIPQALRWYAGQLQGSAATMTIAPETAIPLLPAQMPPGYWSALQQRFANGNQAALIGTPLGDHASGYTNTMVGLAPDRPQQSEPPYRYDKHHLVPFGEFIPPLFRWFTDLMQIPLGDFNRGAVNQPSFAWAGERWAPNICYEDLFGEELASRFVDAVQAPTILVNASNIAWFGDSIAIDQHLQISRMRSLELARPMLRATNTGATAIIDHLGVVQQALPRHTRAVLAAQVAGVDAQPTLFARWAGRWNLWPLWLLGALVLLWAWRGRPQ